VEDQTTMDILLVDHSSEDARIEEDVLGSYLLNPVRTFGSHREALEHVFRQPGLTAAVPQMVFADIGTDPWGALDLVRALRRDARTSQVPIVLMAKSEAQFAKIAPPPERCAFLIQPLDLTRLSEALRCIGVRWVLTDSVPPGMGHGEWAESPACTVPAYA